MSRRAIVSVATILGAATIIFLAIRLLPGDIATVLAGGEGASPETVANVRAEFGLDEPLWVQYQRWLRNAVRLDFGDSFVAQRPAASLVFSQLPYTILLAVVSIVIAASIGIPIGILAGTRPGSRIDRFVSVLSLVGQSMPPFWLGIVLLLVFARYLQWMPSMGSDSWTNLVLPAATLALPMVAILVRMVRQGMLEVLGSGYVEAARGKGLSERSIMYRHVLRNMMIPVITILGLQFGDLLAGSVLVETIFAWPGVGRGLVLAIDRRDYPVIQVAMLVVVACFLLVNFLVDLMYGYLDPRVRLEEK